MSEFNKKKNNNAPTQEITRVRTPNKYKREILAIVESLVGVNRVRLRCIDGVVRMGRLPGSMKKKIWIREGDIVIAIPWDFQDAKAEVVWKYSPNEVSWLERNKYL